MTLKFKLFIFAAGASLLAIGALPASAADATYEIRFQDYHFVPQTLAVTAGQPLIIKVANSSNETIEFESFKLNREKAVTPGETAMVHLPALGAGRYDFYDDFHQDIPEGSIVAK
ncbi:MAG TPA: cupredoxin domain-containing protein [Candidatus Binataceae bacterium]|nr:cupredoxin domain-containing protein [Candidatus Binataceae bacterium]